MNLRRWFWLHWPLSWPLTNYHLAGHTWHHTRSVLELDRVYVRDIRWCSCGAKAYYEPSKKRWVTY